MFIVVNHNISNPEQFWKTAMESAPQLPEANVQRVIQSLPNADMSKSVCLWEADNIDSLSNYIRSKMGDWSTETYYEVNTANAMAMPA
jgi:hypothetical protein